MMMASMWCGCGHDTKHVPMNSVSLEWLFTNASVLLWADKVLVARQDFDNLHLQEYFDDEVDKECAQLLFGRLHSEGVLETFDPGRYLNELTLRSISEQVDRDEAEWGIDPGPPDEDGRRAHDTIRIGENTYCPPILQGIYGSLTLARFLDCSCVFDSIERTFLEDRFSSVTQLPEARSGGLAVFTDLYEVLLPSVHLERDYHLFCHPELGASCKKAKQCQADAKNNLQKLLEYILIARDKPELKRLALHLDALENEVGGDETRIRQALVRDVTREQRNLRAVYPMLRHWSRLVQKASAPAILYGTQQSQPLVWMTAAGLAAAAEALHVSVDALEDKHRWLTLIAEQAMQSGGPGSRPSGEPALPADGADR